MPDDVGHAHSGTHPGWSRLSKRFSTNGRIEFTVCAGRFDRAYRNARHIIQGDCELPARSAIIGQPD